MSKATGAKTGFLTDARQLRVRITGLCNEMAKPSIPPNRPPPGFKVPKAWGKFD